MPITISLFAGAGGCSLGFEQAGYEIIYASDINRSAVATYKQNFFDTRCEEADIIKLDFHQLLQSLHINSGDLDFLIGGPPCQGFSTAGMRFWDDPRNSLLKQYVRALEIIRPKWFLMENVEGLLTAKSGQYLFEAAKAFITLGYKIRVDKIYAHEYGVPQRRKRVFIIGNRLGYEFDLPTPKNHITGTIFRKADLTLSHAIAGLPAASLRLNELVEYDSEPLDDWERQIRSTTGQVSEHFVPDLNELQLTRIRALKPGQTMKHLPKHLQHESFKRRAYRRVMDGTPTEKRGGAPSGLKRLIANEPCLTITGAATREFIHPTLDRPLTIRECARIQTFPDNFEFRGTATQKIQQIGNAIPPMLAEIFAEHINEEYGFTSMGGNSGGALIGFTLTKANAMSPALASTQDLLRTLISKQGQYSQLSLFG
jgi:DNA (cytosine-5)-methyltransferase 1